MSAKDDRNALSKIKTFFRLNKSGNATTREKSDYILKQEVERELQIDSPIQQRCRVLKELGEVVKNDKLEEGSIERLWELTKDLVTPDKPAEQRQCALIFYQKVIQGQYEGLSILRNHFFRVIQQHQIPEDIYYRLELLNTLTDNGKDITYFEEIIGAFMLEWFQAIVAANITDAYLEILVNIIKFNAAHLDKPVVVGLIQNICCLICQIEDTKTILLCLQVIDATMCYAIFPNETLSWCILTLCRTANRDTYCQTSWKIMKNLLGTNLGYAALVTMCNILGDRSMYGDEALLRGAVFHINMGLWGSPGPIISMFRDTPSTVLSCFLQALQSQKVIVTYEVILSIHGLIKANSIYLSEPTWDIICNILETITENISFYESTFGLNKDSVLQNSFHETLNTIETLIEKNEIAADPDKIYYIINKVADDRSEKSVLNLMDYKVSKISSTQPIWLWTLSEFMDRFYKLSNTTIRVKSVQTLIKIMDLNRCDFEEEILERVVIPQFINIHLEKDLVVRNAVGKLLLEFISHCETKTSLELLGILEKLLWRPFDLFDAAKHGNSNEADIKDAFCTVDALMLSVIDVFIIKLYCQPSTHAAKLFFMLTGILKKTYRMLSYSDVTGGIRTNVFNWLLKLRANSTFHIGYPHPTNSTCIRFSYNICIEGSQISQQVDLQNINSTIPIKKIFQRITECFQYEKDWLILKTVFEGLPNLLQNKVLLVNNDNMDKIAKPVILCLNKNYVDGLSYLSNKINSSDMQALVLPVIIGLIPYNQYLSQPVQEEIIAVLRSGIFTKTRVCVHAFTLMLLEMPDMMIRHLPNILIEISKVTTTVNVAIPLLEFLSTLNRLSTSRFANFTPRQYMCVFAISLTYTNPYKYDHYIVSLAHHVIAGWFLKCRLSFRKDYVGYIIKGLKANVETRFQEIKRVDFAPLNEDSSNRKRSSSLTEQGSRRRDQPLKQLQAPKADDGMYIFHMELAETCIDFLVRHTYSPFSALPNRLPTTDFLLSKEKPQTWLVGHNLITITTSACSSIPRRDGFCDRCSLLCRTPHKRLINNTSSITAPLDVPFFSTTTGSDVMNKGLQQGLLQSSNNEVRGKNLSSLRSTLSTETEITRGEKYIRQMSNDGRFVTASNSLESLSRRGSTPDAIVNNLDIPVSSQKSQTHQQQHLQSVQLSNSQQQYNQQAHHLQKQQSQLKQICACSCSGWAEIYIRRPTGNMSWIMRIQNQVYYNDSVANEFPLHDLVSLFTSSPFDRSPTDLEFNHVPEHSIKKSTTCKSELNKMKLSTDRLDIDPIDKTKETKEEELSNENRCKFLPQGSISGPINIPKSTNQKEIGDFEFETEADPDCHNDDKIDYYADENIKNYEFDPSISFEDIDSRSRNPVRRVNSSPEMSSNWRLPYVNQKFAGNNVPTVNNLLTTKNPDEICSANITCGLLQSSSNKLEDDLQHLSNIDPEQQQKKKNYGKDLRAGCEAIPEEIVGSTPPNLLDSVTDEGETLKTIMPCVSVSVSANQVSETQQPVKQTLNSDCTEQTILENVAVTPTKLRLPLSDMPKLTAKPPHSPAPLSPRLLARNAANKIGNFPSTNNYNNSNNNENDTIRGRSKTISVFREQDYDNKIRSGFSPSFVFLQLFNSGPHQYTERPLLVRPSTPIALLDLIPPFERHKIGVLYVGPGQCNNEVEILKNRYGSRRYANFVKKLGTLIALKDVKKHHLFVDMDTNGSEGKFASIWKDDIVQVIFHVATLMLDVECNVKKKYIGNDFVKIVYNESGEEYNLNTIKGQFNYANIIVQPLELNSNRIFIRANEVVTKYICHVEPTIVSDSSAPVYARQLALHANLASLVACSLKQGNHTPYASNWLERLRKIKNIQKKLSDEISSTNADHSIASTTSKSDVITRDTPKEDFTAYTT